MPMKLLCKRPSAHAAEQSGPPVIAKTPVSGLLEVTFDDQVFYLTEDGRHRLGGPLIDTLTKLNLTDAR
jgi:hypothetical protein